MLDQEYYPCECCGALANQFWTSPKNKAHDVCDTCYKEQKQEIEDKENGFWRRSPCCGGHGCVKCLL